jgi:hypothetical protein
MFRRLRCAIFREPKVILPKLCVCYVISRIREGREWISSGDVSRRFRGGLHWKCRLQAAKKNDCCVYDNAHDCCLKGTCTKYCNYTNGERVMLFSPRHYCHVATILAIRNSLCNSFGLETFFINRWKRESVIKHMCSRDPVLVTCAHAG